MKRFKMKSTDFVSMLKESVLFSDSEIEQIAADCGKDQTVSGIIAACSMLDIELSKGHINQLCQMDINI